MKRFAILCLISLLTLWIPESAKADSALELLKDIEVHGFASSSYSYNMNRPPDRLNRYRVYDFDNNSFKFDVGELVLKKDAKNAGDIGFRVDLNYGFSHPQVNKAAGGPNVNGTNVSDQDFDVQIGYVSYNAPVGNGLLIDVGKFATHIGSEVMDGYDGWNYNFSRTFLFNFGPFTHTGVRMQYAVNNKIGLLAMVANGQDNQTDTNDAKGFGGQVSILPTDGVSLYLNYFSSAEPQPDQTNNSDDRRNFYDVVAEVVLPYDSLLNVNFVYGNEDNALAVGRNANWWGFSGILRHNFNKWSALNVRGAVFDDDDGFRSGTAQRLWSLTFTPEVRINNNVVVRAEYRRDKSNVTPFTNRDGTSDDVQETVALNTIFYF